MIRRAFESLLVGGSNAQKIKTIGWFLQKLSKVKERTVFSVTGQFTQCTNWKHNQNFQEKHPPNSDWASHCFWSN